MLQINLHLLVKYLRVKNSSFVNEELSEALMHRKKLINEVLKEETAKSRLA